MSARPETSKDHSERINLVIQYVHSHMDEPLDLDLLAQISCYSPYHFHRVIRAFIGESIGAYDYIFGKYIPENNIELRNTPCLEKYLNSPDKTKPENLKTEICIPVE